MAFRLTLRVDAGVEPDAVAVERVLGRAGEELHVPKGVWQPAPQWSSERPHQL